MGTRIEITLIDDTTKIYEEEQVVSANIFEANDPLSRELQASTAEIVLHSGTGEFDFFNSSDMLDKMAVNQKVIIKYNFSNDVTTQIGVYYVDNWKVEANDHLRLNCVDAIGLLDKHIFREEFDTISIPGELPYIRYPIGQFLQIAGIIQNKNELYNHSTSGNASALEGGLLIRCTTPPILTCRELAMSIFGQYNLNLLFDAQGTPNLFTTGKLYDNNRHAGRPFSNDVVRKNRILFATNDNETPSKIKSIEKELYQDLSMESAEIIFDEKASTTAQTLFLDGNYTDYAITNGTIISSTRCSVTFTANNGSNKVTITARRYTHKTSVKRTQLLTNNENGDIVKTSNALGSDYGYAYDNINEALKYYNDWNNGFIATIEFLLNSDMKERAGTKIKIELEQGKAYNGVITQLDIDLTGGMIATATILCDKTYSVIND